MAGIPILTSVPAANTPAPTSGGNAAYFISQTGRRMTINVKTTGAAENAVTLYRYSAVFGEWVADTFGAQTCAAASPPQATRWDSGGQKVRCCLVGTVGGNYEVVEEQA